jgi:hypothetical protein
MDARPSTDPRDEPDSKLEVKPGSMLEVVAISIAWLCGLGVLATALMTQNTGPALQGLALFFATYFYTLVRAYQLRRTDHDVVRVVHVNRRSTDPFLWVDYLPKSASGKQI